MACRSFSFCGMGEDCPFEDNCPKDTKPLQEGKLMVYNKNTKKDEPAFFDGKKIIKTS